MLVANNKKVLGERVNGAVLNVLGTLAVVAMTAAIVLFAYLELSARRS